MHPVPLLLQGPVPVLLQNPWEGPTLSPLSAVCVLTLQGLLREAQALLVEPPLLVQLVLPLAVATTMQGWVH